MATSSRARGAARRGRPGSARVLIGLLVVLGIVAAAIPTGLFVLPGLLPSGVLARNPPASAAPSTNPAAVPAQGTPTALAVPADASSAPAPAPTGVAAALAAAQASTPTGIDVSAAVLDAATGRAVYQDAAAEPRIPASNLKLLSSLAVLATLDPRQRITTTAVRGSRTGDVVLVGAGDVMLGAGASDPDATMGHAGLRTLAERTAASLRAAGVRGTVRVSVDTSRFTGPVLNPAWQDGDVAAGEIGPVTPLALYSGHTRADAAPGERPADPAVAAGEAFAAALRVALAATAGSATDVAPTVTRAAAAPAVDGGRLGAVDSATVGEQVRWLLDHSDNDVAEALTRVAAHAAGAPTDPAGAARFVRDTVARLGLSVDGLVVTDASGLADTNRVGAATLAGAVRRAVVDERFADAAAGLPIAALTGTLAERFDDPGDAAGAGVVRAKTGTLNAASTLSGYVVDRDGRLLVFAFMAANPPGSTAAARAALDRAAAALAGCGCR
ncbi:hypothetical protein GCM10011512_00010 [Tersicoccus solisilvae]|uniref:D-alanyl-D-alanine carboxypeptidase/D-alanyl-D-alanine-endopeptidase n=1 Tax=Tersicoccus solisilvae TaxID=1882339 RepID=A0ABQ1NKC5_9MICC|nr:D-alanyl-D-alanine carboxypeptidase [Tersicoccus solisilvae]GGC77475.1 hypothetical protein GCM10011512_00010 [Tersicoccus solisilvae]